MKSIYLGAVLAAALSGSGTYVVGNISRALPTLLAVDSVAIR